MVLAQLAVERQTVPVVSGNVQVRAAVKSAEVREPVKVLAPEELGVRAMASALAVGELAVRLPVLSTMRTLAPEAEATKIF